MADQPITEADVQSLSQKLAEFNKTLTPGELAALTAVVTSGMRPAEDVQGYIAPSSFIGSGASAGGDPPSLLQPILSVYVAKKRF